MRASAIIVILIIIIAYYVWKFQLKHEQFAPYISTQVNDMPRSDAAFDVVPVRTHKGDPAKMILPAYPAGPLGHTTENYLFSIVSVA
jgi:hypothetical protein